MPFHALIPCAGSGARLAAGQPKQYLPVAGAALVVHTLRAFAALSRLARIVLVVQPGDAVAAALVAAEPALAGRVELAAVGGATRAASVAAGLDWLLAHGADADDRVLVHDAARCGIQAADIERLLDAAGADAAGGLLALPLPDTLKRAEDGRVAATLPRGGLWLAQTPQLFALGLLRRALAEAAAAGAEVTDEASAVERLGLQPRLVEGSSGNFKVTYAADLELAAAVLERARRAGGEMQAGDIRVGYGDDIHALVPGRRLRLGGVEIAHHAGLLGHSDADALLHAITDALLGGAALGDIGSHFPDTDARWKGADSGALLAAALAAVHAAGWTPVNVDCTVHAQAPRLGGHRDAMRASIAALLQLPPESVNVKAKTAERLGPVGRHEAISASAVCLLARRR
jgi:2-C-methyl-D-erythritol 4-phosphate cytidylyltransferase/2-C-methyl-D-erythritol 2,4-cyclodiphosphate synthase